jgi:uncharacterized protein with PQ loop repeat
MSVVGWVGSLLLACCGLPELIRTLQDKKCHVGWGMLIMWLSGELLTFVYVLPKMDLPLLANYSLNIAILLVLCYYKLKNGNHWMIDN